MEKVVLVSPGDEKVGVMDKLEAHKGEGVLHRAISVLLYRDGSGGKQVLLQKRSRNKPLWPGFWSNTVCTHPREGEGYIECARRRLREELGIVVPEKALQAKLRFSYKARYNHELGENELDTVIAGYWTGGTDLDPKEVAGVRWESWRQLMHKMEEDGDKFTPWFKMIVGRKEVKRIFWEAK